MARRNQNKNYDQGLQPDQSADSRAEQALKLRRIGYDYDSIAKQCGYSNRGAAFNAVKSLRKKLMKDDALAIAQIQSEQIDAALVIVNKRIAKDDEYSLYAIDRLVSLHKRQAELLGLDAKADTLPAGATIVREVGADLGQL